MIGLSKEEVVEMLKSMPHEKVFDGIAKVVEMNNARLEKDIKKMLKQHKSMDVMAE